MVDRQSLKFDDTDRKWYAYEDDDTNLTQFQVKWDDTYRRFRANSNMIFVDLVPPIDGDLRRQAANWNALDDKFSINTVPMLKYDDAGNSIWCTMTGFGGSNITITATNIYTTSPTSGTQNGLQYGMFNKYDLLGRHVWAFNEIAASDFGQAIAVDGSGNVYGVGVEVNNKSIWKLDNNGIEQWNYDTNGTVNGVALDSSGNVYAASDRSTNGDGTFSVWKLNSSGVFQAGFDPNGNAEDIKIDGSDKIFFSAVQAADHQLYRLDTSLAEQDNFDIASDLLRIALDGAGNIYVSSGGPESAIKLNSALVEQWSYDQGQTFGIGVDSSGNVYIDGIGYSDGDGDHQWRQLDSSGAFQFGVELGRALTGLAVDSNDDIFVI